MTIGQVFVDVGHNNHIRSCFVHGKAASRTDVTDVTTLQNPCRCIFRATRWSVLSDVTTLQNPCRCIRSPSRRWCAPDVTTLQNPCRCIGSLSSAGEPPDVTTLQNPCRCILYIGFTLFSCFNLAGCYSIYRETKMQSRQVRRRRFGIIHPYFVID